MAAAAETRLGGGWGRRTGWLNWTWLESSKGTDWVLDTEHGMRLRFALRFALVLDDGGSAVMADGLLIENREKRVVIYGIVIASWWGSEHGELRIEDGDCS
ncbi:hypothetical protein M0R45_002514 [Rubus argutus]|uniref:Uncharacterized protein n=1 Tax=Rubus argutus TaxID=59490 RepID=A0AAW1VRA2_RUBAR